MIFDRFRRRQQQYTVAEKVIRGLAVLGGAYTAWQIVTWVGGTIIGVAWSFALPIAVVGGLAYGGKRLLDSKQRRSYR